MEGYLTQVKLGFCVESSKVLKDLGTFCNTKHNVHIDPLNWTIQILGFKKYQKGFVSVILGYNKKSMKRVMILPNSS